MYGPLKKLLKKIHSIGTFWVAKRTLEHLEAIRTHELALVIDLFPPRGSVLEIGGGTGWQSKALSERGYDVQAIDLPDSTYCEHRVWPIKEYDGRIIPYDDRTFDIVYSSNVLEHVPHVREFQKEIHRVLKPKGCVVHVLPSSSWRLWTNVTTLLKTWRMPTIHGEHARNAFTEMYYFSRRRWSRLFRESGWVIALQAPNRLFYTGESMMDSRLSVRFRRKLSFVLGSSCNVFVLKASDDQR